MELTNAVMADRNETIRLDMPTEPASGRQKVLIGIDLGTSACKVAAFSLTGDVVASASRPYPILTPAPGHVEQDPEAWWAAVVDGLREVTAKLAGHQILGVGLSGQSWSAVPVDRDGRVLANTPIWMDTRAQSLCGDLLQRVDHERILRVSGNRLSPTYTTPKILWFRQNAPEVYREAAAFLQSNAFLGLRLTGRATQDLCQAYGLHFFDTTTGQYDAELAADLGVDLAKAPELVGCDEVIGHVLPAVAAETGLPAGTPVVAGGLDAACGTLAAGVVNVGQTQEQGGQAGGMSVVVERPVIDARLILSRHVVPGVWLLQGGTSAGGASLRWAAEQFGHPGESFADISDAVAQVEPGGEGVWFLPYLNGERSPLWDPAACGLLFGLRLSTKRAHVFRAVMEGVAYSLLDNIRVAEEAGAQVGDLYATGGSAASLPWTQIKADVTGRTVRVPVAGDASALGAAMLAGVGVGAYADFDAAVAATARVERTHQPNPEPRYREGFAIYQELYTQLRQTMQKTA